MSRKLVLGDVHIKHTNLDVAQQLFEKVVAPILSAAQISELVLLGDVYEYKAVIRSEAQNFLLGWIQRLKDVRWHVLVGNHDFENHLCRAHSLEALRAFPNVVVYDKPTVAPDLNAFMVPYIHTREEFLAAMQRVPVPTVFCHQGFFGFDYGNGIYDDEGVRIEELPPNVRFVVGHYHRHQVKGPVLYLGTPFSHSFGEANQKKNIAILDANNDVERLICTSDFLPQHRILTYNAVDKVFVDGGAESVKPTDFVQLRVAARKADLKSLDREWAEKLFAALPASLSLRHDVVADDAPVLLQESLSFGEMLKKYLEVKNAPHLFEMGHEILKEVMGEA